MVERGWLPDRRGVTERAVLRKSRTHVIGACCFLEVGQVATGTLRWSAGILSIDMAQRALRLDVRSGQREGRP